ncbi:MAG: acyl-CoA dehydrogenase family protein [Chloroflexi bacterium]|nr:acyl-CoA dehydrogenase family protein [Chloroflexota bacterium]
MDFDLSEEQLMVRQMARDFAEKEIIPTARQLDREERFPWEILKKMAPLGFLGAGTSPKYGGMGLDWVSYCLLTEEVGRASFALRSIISAHMSLTAQTIEQWGTPEQKQKYLPPMCRGEMLGCFATTEPNIGSDVANIETAAVKDGSHWVLNGTKMFISNGGVAGVALVFAQTDKSKGYRGLTAFLVDKGTPGFTARDIHGKLGLRASNTAELVLEDCRVPQEAVLGNDVGGGFRMAMSAFDKARLCVASGCVGLAQACVDASVEYAKNRVQFGKPIGGHQLVQGIISDMILETEAARLLTFRAACEKNKGKPATIETSMAKYYSSEVAFRAANNAIQIHGGYGFIDEFPVERYLRDVRVATLLEGTSQIHKLIIGRDALGINAFS